VEGYNNGPGTILAERALERVPFNKSVHASSASDDWPTPAAFYKRLDREFGFTLDVCASARNTKATTWFGLDHPDPSRQDGLQADWVGSVWCNPPYGRGQRGCTPWVVKAIASLEATSNEAGPRCEQVVFLVPARTDTKWWHTLVASGYVEEVRFVRGRLVFGYDPNGDAAPFPSAVVVMKPKVKRAPVMTFIEAKCSTSSAEAKTVSLRPSNI